MLNEYFSLEKEKFKESIKSWTLPWHSCLWWMWMTTTVSMVQAAVIIRLYEIFVAHVGPFSTNWACLNTIACIVSLPCPSLHFRTAVYPSSWTWEQPHWTQTASTVTRFQSDRTPLGCDRMGGSHHGCDKYAATVWRYHAIMDQNLWGMFSGAYWICATKNLGSSDSKSTNMVPEQCT